jgi:hypothetical protein
MIIERGDVDYDHSLVHIYDHMCLSYSKDECYLYDVRAHKSAARAFPPRTA